MRALILLYMEPSVRNTLHKNKIKPKTREIKSNQWGKVPLVSIKDYVSVPFRGNCSTWYLLECKGLAKIVGILGSKVLLFPSSPSQLGLLIWSPNGSIDRVCTDRLRAFRFGALKVGETSDLEPERWLASWLISRRENGLMPGSRG